MPTNINPQKSIKDWFSPKQTRNPASSIDDTSAIAKPAPVHSKKKAADKKHSKVSTSASEASNLAFSSAASSPRKLSIPTSDHSRKASPKLDLARKLQQFKASFSEAEGATPKSSPSKSLKRRLADTPVKGSPAKVRKLTPSTSPEKREGCDGRSLEDDFYLSEEEEEELGDLSQEERDLRLALRLQRQFDLADRHKLNIVRFKGSDDQYALRRSRPNKQH